MSTSNTKRRRAYIGNLRPRPNLSDNLYSNLFLPHGLHVKNYPPDDNAGGNGGDGGGIFVAAPKMSKNRHHYASTAPSSNYALVEFDDVDYAIQILNGVVFDGRTLRVSKEKTNFGNGSRGRNMGGGFGSSSWAGDDGGDRSRPSRGRQQMSKRGGVDDGKSTSYGVKNTSVSKYNREENAPQNINASDDDDNEFTGDEEIIAKIESAVASEINESSDKVTAAIACTAAMTLLSSVDAFGLGGEATALNGGDATLVNEANLSEPKDENVGESKMADSDFQSQYKDSEQNVDWKKQQQQPEQPHSTNKDDFQSRCQMPLSDLLAEYGEEDINWKKVQTTAPTVDRCKDGEQNVDWKKQQQQPKQPQDTNKDDFQLRCQMPLSDLLAEYGEEDANWKKDQTTAPTVDNCNLYQNTKPKPHFNPREKHKNDKNDNNSMLAHFDKAFIHLELVSFGYKYGAPSHSKRGFTYAHPLPPLDVRDLDRAPGNVAKFTGLSHLVKRALLNPSSKDKDDDGEYSNEKADGEIKSGPQGQSPMRRRANEIADEIISVLVESIDEGGHGAISPLTMTVSIGSEYGRHRAVVLVEHLAVVLRARLRRNDGQCFEDDTIVGENDAAAGGARKKSNGIVKQPVSVGTRHRDVDARHRDEEAFGEDLKREARKAEKQARRQQMEDDDGWDDEGW